MSRDPIRMAATTHLPDRRRRRRHVHRRDPAARRRAGDDPQTAVDAAELRRAVVAAVAACLRRRPGSRGRPRHDGGHERRARASRRADRARHDRGVPRRARAAPPAHPAHVRPVLAQAAAAGPAPRRYEVGERVTPTDGARPLDPDEARAVAARLASRRRRVGRGLPAALVPLSLRTRSSSARSCARSCRRSRSRCRARSCASSASTSAPPRRSSTRTSAADAPYLAGIRSGLDARRVEAPLTIMQSGGVMTAEDAGRAAGARARVGAGGRRRRRARLAQRLGSRTRSPSTWAARRRRRR